MFRSTLPLALMLAAAAAFPAMAQEAVAVDDEVAVEPGLPEEGMALSGPLIRASDVEDSRVYSISEAYDQTFWDSGAPFGPVATEWVDLGEVEDLIIDNTGRVIGVSIDIGGFLGLGERAALVPLEDLRLVQRPENDEFFIITRLSAEQIEESEDISDIIVEGD